MIYEIAGLKISMKPAFPRLREQALEYQSIGKPIFHVQVDPEDARNVVMENPSKGELEYICCSADFCRKIVSYGRFFLHASAVVVDDMAYLFSAPSGTGKSTHTRLWLDTFKGSYILNDDKPIIDPKEDQITVWGSPFSGKTTLHANKEVTLGGICFLHQGTKNVIKQIEATKALAMILNNTYRPSNPQGMMELLDMAQKVVQEIDIYEMDCTMDKEAAQIAYQKMKKGK